MREDLYLRNINLRKRLIGKKKPADKIEVIYGHKLAIDCKRSCNHMPSLANFQVNKTIDCFQYKDVSAKDISNL
jgi:hypothetical protein